MVPKAPRVRRTDWIALPVLGLLTILVVLGGVEALARHLFAASDTKAIDCMIVDDASTGLRAKPNSVCIEKLAEDSLPIEYRFNSCGHRAGMECGPKPPGSYRVVMVGSSFAMGLEVARERSFAATLPVQLSQLTGRQVDLYNEGMESGFPRSVDLQFNAALTANPDLILWVLTPYDIKSVTELLPAAETSRGSFLSRNWGRVKVAYATQGAAYALQEFWGRVTSTFAGTKTGLMLRHYLFSSQTQYVKTYLLGTDDDTGFLKVAPSPLWQDRLRQLDGYAAQIMSKASSAHVPLVAVLLPNRAQAAMLSMGQWPPGFDPYKLNAELRSVIESHGGTYLDVLPGFHGVPNPERGYFPVDGHPNAQGHAIFSVLLARGLANPHLGRAAAPPPRMLRSADRG